MFSNVENFNWKNEKEINLKNEQKVINGKHVHFDFNGGRLGGFQK